MPKNAQEAQEETRLDASMDSPTSTPTSIQAVKQRSVLEQEAAIREAIKAYKNQTMSGVQACTTWGIKKSTFYDRVRGAKPRNEVAESQQRLSPAQEFALAEFCREKARRGEPLKYEAVRTLAERLCGKLLGPRWVARSLLQHNPKLKHAMTQKAESKRSQALNQQAVNSFYDLLDYMVLEFDIFPEDWYNVDEKGVVLGGGNARFHTLADAEAKQVISTGDENRTNITLVECVSATGKALKPLMIHPGASLDLSWGGLNPGDIDIAYSPNGWTSNELGCLWLRKTFEPQTGPTKRGKYRLLIVDGHVSHCSWEFVELAVKLDILVLRLPSHTTHRFQPCDVNVFNHVEREWRDQSSIAFRVEGGINKSNFLYYYHQARIKGCTEANIIKAFEMCGIWPINRNVIKPDDIAPALATTTLPSQPLPASATGARQLLHITTVPLQPNGPPPSSQAVQLVVGRVQIKGLPPVPSRHASRAVLLDVNERLRKLLEDCVYQMEWDHSVKLLGDHENGRLRVLAYKKNERKERTAHRSSLARHLTGAEAREELRIAMRRAEMTEVLQEAVLIFRELRSRLDKGQRELAKEAEALERSSVQAAESLVKEMKKVLSDRIKKQEATEKKRTMAVKLSEEGKSKATRDRNVMSCVELETQLREIENLIRTDTAALREAEAAHKSLLDARKDRIAYIEEQKRLKQARLDEEEDRIAEEDAREKEARAARAAKYAHCRKRPKATAEHWLNQLEDRPGYKENQEIQQKYFDPAKSSEIEGENALTTTVRLPLADVPQLGNNLIDPALRELNPSDDEPI